MKRRLMKYAATVTLFSMLFTLPVQGFAADVPQPGNWPAIISQTSTDPLAVAPGIDYGKVNMTTEDGPMQLNTLQIDTSNPYVGFDAVMAHNKVFSYTGETVSSMANRTGAVAGINSDYYDIGHSQAPFNLHVSNGVLYRSPLDWAAFAIDHDNKPSILKFTWQGKVVIPGTPENISLWEQYGAGTAKPDGQSLSINQLNWAPEWDGLYVYNDKFGSELAASDGGSRRVNVLLEKLDSSGLYEVKAITPNDKVPLLAPNQLMFVGQGGGADWLSANVMLGMQMEADFATSPDWRNYKTIIGGGPQLLKDGEWYEDPDAPSAEERNVRNPVVGLGIAADGKTVQIALFDGRQPNLSIGLTRPQFGEYFKAVGMKDAMAFDSGGSAQMVVRMPGDRLVTTVNSPSDGFERLVANGLFLYNKAPQGELSRLIIEAKATKAFIGSTLQFKVKGVDANNQPVDVPDSLQLTTTVPGATLQSGGLIAGPSAGSGVIEARVGTISEQLPVEVVDTLGALDITPNPAVINPGDSKQFQVSAKDSQGNPVAFDAFQGGWSVEGGIGTIDSTGLLQASESGQGYVLLQAGGVTGKAAVSVGKPPVVIEDFESVDAFTHWSNSAIRATGSVQPSSRPNPVHRGTHSLKLEYDFTNQPSTSASYANVDLPDGRLIEDRPLQIGMWVHADGQPHWLRAQLVDGNNVRKSVDITEDGGMNWVGWKYVTIPIDPDTPLPLRLRQIYVVEPNADRKTKGTVYIDDIRAVYYDMGEDLTGPAITQLKPAEGSTVYSSTPVISAMITDDQSGVEPSSIEMHVDDQLVRPQYDVATKQLTYSPQSPLADGNHHVTIQAQDKAGNDAAPKADFTFTVYTGPDLDAPVIKPISPMNGIVTRTPQPRIAVKLDDAYTGIDFDATKLEIDGVDVAYRTHQESGTIYYTPPVKYEPKSQHSVKVTTSDRSGNRAEMSWSFTADNLIGQPKDPNRFQLSVIGDGGYYTQGSDGSAPDVLLQEQIRRINMETATEFVGYTGDIVDDDQNASYVDAKRVMDTFRYPYLISIGNHEVSGTGTRDNFEQYFGEPTYTYDYGNTTFIVLDSASGKITTSDASQWPWLSETLEASGNDNILIFMHIPPDEISPDGVDFKTGHGFQDPAEAQRFYDLVGAFKNSHPNKNVLVLSGDLHAYQHKKVQGVDYIISGGGGKYTHNTPEQGGFFHYLNMKVEGSQISWDVIPLLEKITFAEPTAQIPSGLSQKLQATADFMTHLNQDIVMPLQAPFKMEWTSSDPSVATVDGLGNVQAVKQGTATIKVKSGWQEASVQVTVTAPVPVSLQIELPDTIKAGKEHKAIVHKIFSDGSRKKVTEGLIFSSSNPAIAAVDSSRGRVSAVSEGEVIISATLATPNGEITGERELVVRPQHK